ncbi:hypothetical protein E2320_006355 [Naja naja]|nr:hypothetical protein E2320_006355 [Naja naja]
MSLGKGGESSGGSGPWARTPSSHQHKELPRTEGKGPPLLVARCPEGRAVGPCTYDDNDDDVVVRSFPPAPLPAPGGEESDAPWTEEKGGGHQALFSPSPPLLHWTKPLGNLKAKQDRCLKLFVCVCVCVILVPHSALPHLSGPTQPPAAPSGSPGPPPSFLGRNGPSPEMRTKLPSSLSRVLSFCRPSLFLPSPSIFEMGSGQVGATNVGRPGLSPPLPKICSGGDSTDLRKASQLP